MTTWHVWSPIKYDAERDPDNDKVIVRRLVKEIGDTVTAEEIGLDDEQFQALVDGGSVRDYPLPEELRDTQASPSQLMAKKLVEMTDVAGSGVVSAELVNKLVRTPTPEPTADTVSGTEEIGTTGESPSI